MIDDKPIYEKDRESDAPDPDEVPIRERKVVTQPYDLAIDSLIDQIRAGTIFLRPLSERPDFQRRYVWTDILASRLIESIFLNVPIPPCYLSQNEEFELDVIDGQQRLFSIYRFIDNQFPLKGLEVLTELNGKRFHAIPNKLQRRLKTHTLRCMLVTNESHPEVKFDVFERLNTNTVPLNSQELRNCIYRGALNDLLKEAVNNKDWLSILGKKTPDKRMRDEELVLRFFAFQLSGLESYRTPLKHWLNAVAKEGMKYPQNKIAELHDIWNNALRCSLTWFEPQECYRREGSKSINRALYDLVAFHAASVTPEIALQTKDRFRNAYNELLANEEFQDLISRSVDHTKRTKRRFQMWDEAFEGIL